MYVLTPRIVSFSSPPHIRSYALVVFWCVQAACVSVKGVCIYVCVEGCLCIYGGVRDGKAV